MGVKSKNYAVIAALKRSSSELGAHQKKLFKIDDHIGIAISGLTGERTLLPSIDHSSGCSRVVQVYAV